MSQPLFNDAALQQSYEEVGYARFQALDAGAVHELREDYRRLTLEDVYGIGYTVSLYSRDLETRKRAHQLLVEKAFPSVARFLVLRRPYMGTYLVKEPNGRIIPPHQDWSHCDEQRDDSVMCWIPLNDADEHNGGLGFIDGSHQFFDYLRAFPYEVVSTPVVRHSQRLTAYLNIQRMKAGEAVVFNNRIIHGSLGNYGPEPRMALSFALHPEGEPLLFHYLKPGGPLALLRYRVGPDFYLAYQQPTLLALYKQHQTIPEHEPEELGYSVPALEWEELQELVIAAGNRRDPWKATRAAEALGNRA
jgi:hypothetical protein